MCKILHRSKPSMLYSSFIILVLIISGCGNEVVTYQENEFIKNWLILGPLPNCEDCPKVDYKHDAKCQGFHRDYLSSIGGEANALPREGDLVSITDKDLEKRWIRYKAETDLIPLNEIMTPNDTVVAYAFCQIESDVARKSILSIGSNDGVKVFNCRSI